MNRKCIVTYYFVCCSIRSFIVVEFTTFRAVEFMSNAFGNNFVMTCADKFYFTIFEKIYLWWIQFNAIISLFLTSNFIIFNTVLNTAFPNCEKNFCYNSCSGLIILCYCAIYVICSMGMLSWTFPSDNKLSGKYGRRRAIRSRGVFVECEKTNGRVGHLVWGTQHSDKRYKKITDDTVHWMVIQNDNKPIEHDFYQRSIILCNCPVTSLIT